MLYKNITTISVLDFFRKKVNSFFNILHYQDQKSINCFIISINRAYTTQVKKGKRTSRKHAKIKSLSDAC